jgi:hypothetical protein
MQTTYTTAYYVTTSAKVAIAKDSIKDMAELTDLIYNYQRAADGSIVTRPKDIQDDIMYVELDGGIEASITLGKDSVEISAYDSEEDLTLDVVATDEVRELIEYFEGI